MTQSKDSSYLSDPESGAEMARLIDQDRLVTNGMGGLFGELLAETVANLHSILDVACGPGGWAQEVAFTYPDKEVVGVDVSQSMIEYANSQAYVQNLHNLSFRVMNASQPLDFPDASFDLINARFLNFLPASVWPKLVQEYYRITRPGGIIRLTESEWWYFTNSSAVEKINSMIIQAIKAQGSYSHSGRFTGILPILGQLLLDVGCVDVQHKAHVIDFSYGTDAYEGFRRDAAAAFKLFQPFILKTGAAQSQEEFEQVYDQMLVDMLQENFRGLMLPLTVWGRKPLL
jgi:SAM-dependent methyltransferase